MAQAALRKTVEIATLEEMQVADQTLFNRYQCTDEDHDRVRANRQLWEQKTIPRGTCPLYSDKGDTIEGYAEFALCSDCGSTVVWPGKWPESVVKAPRLKLVE